MAAITQRAKENQKAYKTRWQREWRAKNAAIHEKRRVKWQEKRKLKAQIVKLLTRGMRKDNIPEEKRPGYCKVCGIFLHGSGEETCDTC